MTPSRHQTHNPLMGIVFMILATLFFASSDAIGKYLTQNYPLIQAAWLRALLGMLMIGLYALFTGQARALGTSRPGWHLLRGIFGTMLILGIFTGLKYLTLAEVAAIIFAAPFFVALLSPWFLGEKVSMHSWLAIIVGFIGVLIIMRPVPGHFHFAHLVMLATALAAALLIVTARRLAGTESVITLNFYLYPLVIVLAGFQAVPVWETPSPGDWGLFLCLALFATLALICVTQAMHHARPSVVAPFDYVRLVWVTILGYLFWGEIPALLTWVGIVLIVISGIYVITHGRSVPEVGVKQEPAA